MLRCPVVIPGSPLASLPRAPSPPPATPLLIVHTRQNALQQVIARKGRPILITTEGDTLEELADCNLGENCKIEVPHISDCLQGVLTVIPMQLLSYHIAVLRGFNIDQPRNLAKSVTVE